jgi:L,D-peptidoglycan transpeptidase YkuD (ErfK/YbiS/YcfS/YnhG family)
MTDALHEDPCDNAAHCVSEVRVMPDGAGGFSLMAGSLTMRCAVGRSGLTTDKKEGDGGTPVGRWPLREAFFRPDKMTEPQTGLPIRALDKTDGWCDAAGDASYNRFVQLPYAASHENLWRDDDVYDVIVVIGYNDDPVVSGKGSAIFLHMAKPDYAPTAGCVAVSHADMEHLLPLLGTHTLIDIRLG